MAIWVRPPKQGRWSRLVWSLGSLANLSHLLLAFHFLHDWSHSAAHAAIARQTYEQSGLDWGGGIYINYAFCALWLFDAGFWWMSPVRYQRRSVYLDGALQFIFLFMFFNATVVFGKSPLRFLGGILCLVAILGWVWNCKRAAVL